MSLIDVVGLTFGYDGNANHIFENVSFQLDTDWKLGLIGRNGKGKTTFLNLLSGAYEFSGTISSHVSFEYFPYPVKDKSALGEEVAGSILGYYEPWMLQRELSLLEASPDILYRPFDTLSNGEQTKLLLAALFLRENSFLLIDEPTNHLDIHGRALLSRYLNRKSSFIVVSHDRHFLDHCIDHVLSINRESIDVQAGTFSSWYQNKQLQDQFEKAENEKLQKDIRRLEGAAKRSASWSSQVEKTKKGVRNSGLRPDTGYLGHKAAKMMQRSKNLENRRQDAVEQKSGLLKNVEETETLKLSPLSYHAKRLLSLDGVSIQYDGQSICPPLSFTVEQGERIVLQGKNGCGKSSILKLICGQPIAHTGMLSVGSGLTISYVPQDASFLTGSLRDFCEQQEIEEPLFKAILRKLDFDRAQFELDLSSYSGGQKKKVLLAGSLCQQAHLYIWDEPLNYIDVFSRIQIEALLCSSNPTLLFVEHDEAFCEAIATKTVQF